MAEKKQKKKDKDDKKTKEKGKIVEPKKNYTDKGQEDLTKFDEFKILAQEPETVLLLLASKEHEVLLRALNHLVKYAEKSPKNASLLKNMKAIQTNLENKLWDHELLFVKRFALKLIAEIFQLENEQFDENLVEQLFSIAREYYINSMDDFLIEYSSAILYNLLREPRICAALEEDADFISTMFRHISETSDPDILYNSYNMLIKLLRSISNILHFCKIETFPFERVLGDVRSEYPEIQKAALETLGEVISCKNEFYESRFVCPMFFEEIFTVLENDLWQDRHLPIIDLLRRLMTTEKIAKMFCRDDYLPRFVSYVKNKEPHKLQALGVLVEIAQYEDHLDKLFLLSAANVMLTFLKDFDKVNGDVCLGIKRMLRHPDAFFKIVEDDPAPHLLKIIKSDIKDLPTRQSAADTLYDILKRSFKQCESAIKNGVSSIISRILKGKFGEVPTDFLLILIQILIALAKDSEIKEKVMVDDLPSSLVSAIKNSLRSGILTANLFNCATAYIYEEKFMNEFLNNSMTGAILRALKSSAVIVKTAVADFIIVTGKMKAFADEYIENGVLEYLLEDDIALSTCPSWSPAIEAIFSTNPTLKFAIRGRLEITDITSEDFAVSKHHWKDITLFRNLLKDEVSPFYPIILVNFEHTEATEDTIRHIRVLDPEFEIVVDSEEESEEGYDWSYCRRPADARLPMYLQQLRDRLETRGLIDSTKTSNSIDITKIADRARVVAEIVRNEMCGPVPGIQGNICSDTAIMSHLNEQKHELHCSIVPLGHIRCGGEFERAILFKVLADKIGLPATLVRGMDGRILYNEIPLPEQAEQPDCALTILPMRLLTPTHIVDLMEHPGELYPLGGRKSYRYQRLL